MNSRSLAIQTITNRPQPSPSLTREDYSEVFGTQVFSRSLMQKMLSKNVYQNLLAAMEGREKIKPEFADIIAMAMKEWAVSHGATHYSHWFQPLTGLSAEKHDSFIDWVTPDEMMEKFSGKQLIQGEPDASSFPSGGLRSTYEARGYTGWDPTSPVFLWKGGDGITLFIPSVFFSWTGDVLDAKIPLLRSNRHINDAVLRLLKLTGVKAEHVYSTLGLEQEYFLIDRALYNLRPDLQHIGRTVFGAQPPKGQELQDHYFGSVKDRILTFMSEFETTALRLGIPVKTRHNEVAPGQYEIAPGFEKASIAIDHNLILMELMRQVAAKQNLTCLLHEKPFHNLNGSGKHSNWSLATDSGLNLLNPTDTPESNFHFLILIVAILHAIHENSTLLRATIGSARNDYRLGGHEAPPAIISVYLGRELERLLDEIERKGTYKTKAKSKYNLGILVLPDLTKDHTDRNRTSPMAFTGDKFEFRAVGSSSSPAMPITAMNLIVADSLNKILDDIEKKIGSKSPSKEDLSEIIFGVLRPYIKSSKNIRFSGDNYSAEWVKEAAKRKLPNIQRSILAFEGLKSPSTIRIFKDVLTEFELKSRYDIAAETYANILNIEVNLQLEIFKTQIFPAVMKYQKDLAKSIGEYNQTIGIHHDVPEQKKILNVVAESIEKALKLSHQLIDLQKKANVLSHADRAKAFAEKVMNKSDEFREAVDHLETLTDDEYWPLPKYRELLFMI